MFKQDSFNTYSFETANFKVIFEISDSAEPFDCLTKDWDEALKKATEKRMDQGKVNVYDFAVKVEYKPTGEELSSVYLGASFYEDPEDFMDHFGLGITSLERKVKKQRGENRKLTQEWVDFYHKHGYNAVGSYFKDMVKEAISEAREAYNQERVFLKQA